MTYRQIIESHNFPRRFLVKYALACVKAIDPTIRHSAIPWLQLTEKWLADPTSVNHQHFIALNRSCPVPDGHAAYYAACAATSASCEHATINAAFYAQMSNRLVDPTRILVKMIEDEGFGRAEMILMEVKD